MENMDTSEEGATTFLKADEVDEAGPVGLDLSQQQQLSENSIRQGLDTIDQRERRENSAAEPGQEDGLSGSGRPQLRRDKWAPAPQQPPPPAPPRPVEDIENNNDSLSLIELRRLVADMPKAEPQSYAFAYDDSSSFEEELEEFFDYTYSERGMLDRIGISFVLKWEQFCLRSDPPHEELDSFHSNWPLLNLPTKEAFVGRLRSEIESHGDEKERTVSLEALLYVCLGCWFETSDAAKGQSCETLKEDAKPDDGQSKIESRYKAYQGHISAIKENMLLAARIIRITTIFSAMQQACRDEAAFKSNQDSDDPWTFAPSRETQACFPLMYLLIDFFRRHKVEPRDSDVADEITSVAPSLLNFLTELLAESRWEEDSSAYPQSKILSLYWKTMLYTFGGLKEVRKIKDNLAQDLSEPKTDDTHARITASPLDYHLFRQEITSKYPAFDPPPPLFPFESDNASMIPPSQEPSRPTTNGPTNLDAQSSSILHQPVHISTPAPSPPPSPAGPGGKGVKKQNYQTNQLFPFVYPPLDASSNDLGGKGSTALQDALVGRKWQGSDIPASILEAADIFSKSMRATRAMKQLWAERVRFMKYERGYDNLERKPEPDGSSDSDEKTDEGRPKTTSRHSRSSDESDPEDRLSADSQRRLKAVEAFYQCSLPKLQSLVFVLLRIPLETLATLVTHPNPHNGWQNGASGAQDQGNDQTKPEQANGFGNTQDEQSESYASNLNNIRLQEIMGKTVSGIILLLLKWFKLSHILKFEYLSQLLLDSNFIQVIFKLFTHQELERVVNYRCDKESWNFFAWCRSQARSSYLQDEDQEPSTSPTSASAAPQTRRSTQNTDDSATDPSTAAASTNTAPATTNPHPPPPEVDELGFPISDLPASPITAYSWRNFFTAINHLRALQKVAKGKTHRQLLMVHYKYSNVIKKCLKVPQPDVRLYSLKVIKGQVPYCHRKWRQGNMRVITAIYLHCKPELRDDWLAGLDMEAEMSEALPAEQALRSLTYWYNLRNYPRAMGRKEEDERARGMVEAEQDFFARELEMIDVAARMRVDGEVEAEAQGQEEVPDSAHREGPVQMEGW